MATDAQIQGWSGPSRRRVPRFQMQAPLDVTVLRSGIPDTVPGRSLNVCERGIAAVLAGELVPGETVGVEVRLSLVASPLRMRAMVRHQTTLRCGLEFLGLSVEQRAAIRDWAKGSKAETETETEMGASPMSTVAMERKEADTGGASGSSSNSASNRASNGAATPRKPKKGRRGVRWAILFVVLALAAAAFWWRWNRGWEELESGLNSAEKRPRRSRRRRFRRK